MSPIKISLRAHTLKEPQKPRVTMDRIAVALWSSLLEYQKRAIGIGKLSPEELKTKRHSFLSEAHHRLIRG